MDAPRISHPHERLESDWPSSSKWRIDRWWWSVLGQNDDCKARYFSLPSILDLCLRISPNMAEGVCCVSAESGKPGLIPTSRHPAVVFRHSAMVVMCSPSHSCWPWWRTNVATFVEWSAAAMAKPTPHSSLLSWLKSSLSSNKNHFLLPGEEQETTSWQVTTIGQSERLIRRSWKPYNAW